MDITIDQQVALDEALVPQESRLKIGKSNFPLRSDLKSKESTLQVVYDVLKLTPFYKAFLVTTDEILAFLRELSHSREIKMITDVNINKLHQPWRSFIAVINKCLSGKSTGYDSLCLSQAQILWGVYHKKNVDFAYLLWEDFVYQVEHKDAKKSNEMYYPRFIKVIVNFFMTKDQSIPRRNKVNWHYARDDHMFTTIKLVSRHQNTQQYGVILPVELTNKAIRNSESYKEYYAITSGAEPPKTKASIRKKQSSSDTTMPPLTATGKRLKTSAKVGQPAKDKQPAKSSTAKGLTVLSEVALTEAEQIKLATKRSLTQTRISHASGSGADEGTDDDDDQDEQDDDDDQDDQDDDDDEQSDSDNNGDDFVHPKFSIHDEEAKDEESFDPIVRTPSHDDKTDDEDNDEDSRDIQMADVQTTQVIEDTHVTLTLVNPEGQQQSSSMSSRYVLNMLNLSLNTGVDSIFDSPLRIDVSVTTAAEPPLLSVTNLPPPTISIILHVQQTPAPSPENVPSLSLQDLPNFGSLFGFDHRFKLLKQTSRNLCKQTNFLKSFLRFPLEAEVLTRSSNSSKTSYVVAADLSELEPKKILIEKMESNKSIHKSNKQKNFYKALVDAYECNKLILDTYGDTVTLKRRRDDKDKDKEPSAGSNRGRIQPWIRNLAKKADSHTSFNELMDTAVDFSAFVMNRLKVDTLTPELLDDPTYELMKGSCKSLVELEFFLEEVYKETTDQLDWNNPEGQQYPHDLLKPLPLIPNS
uniref:Monodehydroascorbate reductase n=1 Tax=Tanacetum cinerariifolium TaxID=118510 RepID=A0A6L2L7I9_TANCI|nr:hypothetical protein [Tanacetum cinerariifolium]